jgi:hypothetical protein
MSYSLGTATIVLHMLALPAALPTDAEAFIQPEAILRTFYDLDSGGSL